jgi:hypothetical protein
MQDGDRAGGDHVDRLGELVAGSGHERAGCVVVLDHCERWIDGGAERHGWHAE